MQYFYKASSAALSEKCMCTTVNYTACVQAGHLLGIAYSGLQYSR